MRLFSLCLLLPSCLYIFSMASADPTPSKPMLPENVWYLHETTLRYKGNGYSDKVKANTIRGEILFTTSMTKSGLYFSCFDGKFRVGTTFTPQNLPKAFSGFKTMGISGDGKFVPVPESLTFIDMTLNGGDKIGLGRWLIDKDAQAVKSRSRKPSAKIYNAIARKQNITIHMGRKEAVLDLPKINAAFADFGAGCGLGRKAKKDK